MANAELRELARKYSEGLISWEEYRSQRGQVLEALSMNVSQPDDATPTRRFRRPTGVAKARTSLRGLVLLGLLALTLAAVAAWFLLRGGSPPQPVQNQPVAADTPVPVVAAPSPAAIADKKPEQHQEPTPARVRETVPKPEPNSGKKEKSLKTLAGALLNIKRWTPQHLEAFGKRWRAFSARKQAAARDTTWFLQLKYELYRRIAKQRARASLGNADAADQADRLVRFANELGLEAVG